MISFKSIKSFIMKQSNKAEVGPCFRCLVLPTCKIFCDKKINFMEIGDKCWDVGFWLYMILFIISIAMSWKAPHIVFIYLLISIVIFIVGGFLTKELEDHNDRILFSLLFLPILCMIFTTMLIQYIYTTIKY